MIVVFSNSSSQDRSITITSIPRLSGILRKRFFAEANQLARQAGVIQRERVFSGASFVQLLVFGWLTKPQGGASHLARFAGSLGLKLSKQAIEERFTMRTADWLLAVLGRGVQFLVCAQAMSIPLLKRFSAVLVEDGSTISLPAALKQVWRGCGGSSSEADLKLTVCLDLLRGSLCGPSVQEGRRHETQSPLREQQMPGGSLWIGDLGYFALTWLTQLVKQGVFFLMGYKEPVVMWNAEGERVEVLALLPTDGSEMVDIPVVVGVRKQVQARLIAKQMPQGMVKRRREQLKEQAHKQCKPINPPAVGSGAMDNCADQCATAFAGSGRGHGLDAGALANRTALEVMERPGQGRCVADAESGAHLV